MRKFPFTVSCMSEEEAIDVMLCLGELGYRWCTGRELGDIDYARAKRVFRHFECGAEAIYLIVNDHDDVVFSSYLENIKGDFYSASHIIKAHPILVCEEIPNSSSLF